MLNQWKEFSTATKSKSVSNINVQKNLGGINRQGFFVFDLLMRRRSSNLNIYFFNKFCLYSLGDIPTLSLKNLPKKLWLVKLKWYAISLIGIFGLDR